MADKATSVCIVTQQQGNRHNTKRHCCPHELTLPREHHHFFMRCQPHWVRTRFSRCATAFLFTTFPTRGSPSSASSLRPVCLFGLVSFQVRVGGQTTDVQLVKLLPNTAYTLSLFALHGESASEPLTKQGVTCS